MAWQKPIKIGVIILSVLEHQSQHICSRFATFVSSAFHLAELLQTGSLWCTTNLNNLEFKRIRCQNCIYISRKKLEIYYDSRRRISFQQLQFNIISVQKCMFHPKVSEASPRRSEHTLETARSFEAPEKITATEQKYDQIFQGKKLSKFRIIKVVLVEKSGD